MADIETLKTDTLKTWAATIRWQKQNAGVAVGGITVPTDSETRGIVTAAYVLAIADPAFTVPNWKVAPGEYVELSAAQIIAMSQAMRAHVQACFDTNKSVDAAIDAGAITTHEQIVSAFEGLGR